MYVAYKFWLFFILRTCSRAFGNSEGGKSRNGRGRTQDQKSSDREEAMAKQVNSAESSNTQEQYLQKEWKTYRADESLQASANESKEKERHRTKRMRERFISSMNNTCFLLMEEDPGPIFEH